MNILKIINREQFLKLPNGVLYAKFEPCVFGDIAIKEDSSSNGWLYQDLLELDVNDSGEWTDTLFEAIEKGTSFKLDYDCLGRDGMFDDKQLFAVFEKEDVVMLIERLKKTVLNYPKV